MVATESRYEVAINLGSDLIKLIKAGFISPNLLTYKIYYEKFLEEREHHKKEQAYQNVAEEFRVSAVTVKRAVKFMRT